MPIYDENGIEKDITNTELLDLIEYKINKQRKFRYEVFVENTIGSNDDNTIYSDNLSYLLYLMGEDIKMNKFKYYKIVSNETNLVLRKFKSIIGE